MVAEPTRNWIAWEAWVQPDSFRRGRIGDRRTVGRKKLCAGETPGVAALLGTRNCPGAGILAPDSGMAGVNFCAVGPLGSELFLGAVKIRPGELDMGLVNYWPGNDPSYAPRFPEVAWTELGPRR